jgi:hypothetical protein
MDWKNVLKLELGIIDINEVTYEERPHRFSNSQLQEELVL